MLIICKSCKKLIDTDKHDFCPKCGSNFNYGENLTAANHTADYEEYERRMAEQQRAAVENRMSSTKQATRKETQRRLKNQANQATGKKNGCIGCFVAVLVVFVMGMSFLSEIDFDFSELLGDEYGAVAETVSSYIEEEIPDNYYVELPDISDYIETDTEYTEPDNYEYIYGALNIPAYTDTYTLTLTEVSVYENEFITADEGNMYVSFNLVLENITGDSRLYLDSINCRADGEDVPPASFGGIYFPGELEPGETYERTLIFEVPEDSKWFDIYYGDDVMILASVYDIAGYEVDEDDWYN